MDNQLTLFSKYKIVEEQTFEDKSWSVNVRLSKEKTSNSRILEFISQHKFEKT